MNKKIYKGLEIMEMISKGNITEHQKFKFENNNFDGDVEYYNGTLYWLVYDEEWNLKDKKNLFDMFNIQSTMVADFEILENNTEERETYKEESFEQLGYEVGKMSMEIAKGLEKAIKEMRKEITNVNKNNIY